MRIKTIMVMAILVLLVGCSNNTSSIQDNLSELKSNSTANINGVKELIMAQCITCPACPECLECKETISSYDEDVSTLLDRIGYLERRIEYYQGMEDEDLLFNLTIRFERCNKTLHEVNNSLTSIREALE